MGKKTKKDTFWFYLILVVSVLMVNPPFYIGLMSIASITH